MKNLTLNEIDQVNGANTVGDGLTCAGSLIVMGATDGVAAVLGAGVVAVGSCISFGDDLGFGGGSIGDNGVQCTYTP